MLIWIAITAVIDHYRIQRQVITMLIWIAITTTTMLIWIALTTVITTTMLIWMLIWIAITTTTMLIWIAITTVIDHCRIQKAALLIKAIMLLLPKLLKMGMLMLIVLDGPTE